MRADDDDDRDEDDDDDRPSRTRTKYRGRREKDTPEWVEKSGMAVAMLVAAGNLVMAFATDNYKGLVYVGTACAMMLLALFLQAEYYHRNPR